MKLGIISDIHSNNIALNEVLKEFKKLNIDKIICCGDIIGIGPEPENTIQTLIKIQENLIAVRGNHEKYLIDGLPINIHDDKRKMSSGEIENHKWTHSRISNESKRFLESLEVYKNIEIENKRIYIVHYPMEKDGTYKKHIKTPTISENEEMFNGLEEDIYIYGHIHTTSINNKDGKWYINPRFFRLPFRRECSRCWCFRNKRKSNKL